MPDVGRKRQSTVLHDDGAGDHSRPGASKRPRLNGHTLGSTNDNNSMRNGDRLVNGNASSSARASSATSGQLHKPGSIKRVSLKNFLSYSSVEFLPGPSLNMIIGPNGTGKSSLVCAICLGLGWKTEHLGRAKAVKEFIKHGSREATIEIQLARGPDDPSDPVVKTVIKRDTEKTHFFLDGRPSTTKAVAELCRSFSIQVDNLCQFLPQDRVVEFSALSPVDLLTQTQRAVAEDYLVQWHEQLKSLRIDQRRILQDQTSLGDGLKNLEARQNNQRADVERLRERTEVQEELEAVKKLRPIAQYRVLRNAYLLAKDQKSEACEELTRFEADAAPAMEAIETQRRHVSAIERHVAAQKALVERLKTKANQSLDKQKRLKQAAKEVNDEVAAERNSVKTRNKDKAQLEANIANFERQMSQAPPSFDAAGYNDRLRVLKRTAKEVDAKLENVKEQRRSAESQLSYKIGSKSQLEKRAIDLQSRAGRQAEKLKQVSSDAFQAWQWLQNNRHKITGTVYDPPIVSCSVIDPTLAPVVESVVGTADLVSFTVTTREAYNSLQQILYRDLRLADINIKTVYDHPDHDNYGPPIPKDQIAALGFDNYLVDLLEGPRDVIRMLCKGRGIHSTLVSSRTLTSQQASAIQRNDKISSYATPHEINHVIRRKEFGSAGTSTRNARVRPSKFFGNSLANKQAEAENASMMKALELEISLMQTEVDALQSTINGVKEEASAAWTAYSSMEAEKDVLQAAVVKHSGIGTRLNTVRGKLALLQEAENTHSASVQETADRESDLIRERAEQLGTHINNVHSVQLKYVQLVEAEMQLIEAQSTLERVENEYRDIARNIALRQSHVDQLIAELEKARKAAQGAKEKAAAMTQTRTTREIEIQKGQPQGQTVEELETEIEALQARLEMFHEGDPNVVREFEERAKKIEKTQQRLVRFEQELVKLQADIATVQAKWEPEVDQLVGKISDAFADNFSRINCAGEVRVYKEEEFSNWSIQILVRFRENESLSILDNHRQSGGERAVSTIFYLMAMQSLARAPFRVVDEINQGMDPRNERLVHKRIVDIACAENTSQYFLITPKLLPNLAYHENMKIHCIASGVYMPDDYRELDFETLAQKALQIKAAMPEVGRSIAQTC